MIRCCRDLYDQVGRSHFNFNCFKMTGSFAFCVVRNFQKIISKIVARGGCNPESFVGNYAVNYVPGAHFPAMTREAFRLWLLPGEAFAKVQR
jgi:hypothetical protein